ncbi:MAG: DUF2244 domain-containing protein [Burkholderiales bacterium]
MSTLSMDGPRRELDFAATATGFRVVLKRNCSISPRGLLLAFGLIAAIAATIATGFALLGAWLILPFAGLEIAVLAGAFWLTARHATDYERIEREGERLRVEVGEGARELRHEFEARRARVGLHEGRVMLVAPRVRLELGRHLDAASRAGFAAELVKRLLG